MHAEMIFKIVPASLWQEASTTGTFSGSPVDTRDGFIHFSTAAQVRTTAERHFRGEADLLLIGVRTNGLALKWEPSRGGDLFPHLYQSLPLSQVAWVERLPLGASGKHQFPAFLEDDAPRLNEYGQRTGAPLPGWVAPPVPEAEVMQGRFCELRPLELSSADALFEAFSLDADDREWTYLPYGPFPTRDAFGEWMSAAVASPDYVLFSIHSGDEHRPTGIAAYLRIQPASGSIEVGHLRFSRRLQRTPAATEAMYVMMKRAFDLGYRRYEWKCDAFNEPSRRAASRLGFSFEGVFRQATVYKGRTRDTAWFSVVDAEWPSLRQAFELWLDPSNFEADGRQKSRLENIRAGLKG
jgi:uncharacterized protein (DUF952 family)/RimJ/RimL family protein N-acetyltransferase